MAKRSARSATPKPVATVAELGKLVERDGGTVSRWLQRDDWPFARHAPWARSQVPKILRWVADTLLTKERGDEGHGEQQDGQKLLRWEKLRQEVRKLHAQADAAETALARERGRLLDAGEVEADWASIGVMVRNAFQNLASQLVPLALSHGMPNEAAPAFGQQVEETVGGVLRHLSRGAASTAD